MFIAACVQVRSTSNVSRNLSQAEALIRRAASAGAKLIATPEATTYLGPHDRKIQLAESLEGPTHQYFANLASELGVYLLLGSGAEISSDAPKRCHNTSMLFAPDGSLVSSYRKLHLFDVDIPDGVRFQESATCAPGEDVVIAQTELGVLGMSICYDLRFPELYRSLRDRGAEILMVPSAFTLMTGKDHWHALLRARAIENQCFVIAPGQWGNHDDKGLKRSYGHSLIIDPWGVVLADAGEGEGICLAEIDLQKVHNTRKAIPLDQHRRL